MSTIYSRTIHCTSDQQDSLAERLAGLMRESFEFVGGNSRYVSSAIRRYQIAEDGKSFAVEFDEGLLEYFMRFNGIQTPDVGSVAEFEQTFSLVDDFVKKHPYSSRT